MNCEKCTHKQNPDGGHCYMFRTQPAGNYCAQFNASDTIRQRMNVLKSLQGTKLGTIASIVIEHK